MKTLKIGFSKPKNRIFPIFSWLIRLYQRTAFSHTYITFKSSSLDRTLVYEAVAGGIRFVGTQVWQEHAETVREFELSVSDDQYTEILQFCVDNAGKDYAFLQSLGVLIANLFKLKKNPFREGTNCSEMLSRLLERLDYVVGKPHDLVTPKDIYLFMDKK